MTWSGPMPPGDATRRCRPIGARRSITRAICMVRAVATTSNAELRCIELASGKIVWSEPNLTRTTLLYVDGYFVSLGEHGALRLVKVTPEQVRGSGASHADRQGRQQFGPAPLLKFPAWAPPVLSHGLLYVRGAGRLVCVELIPPESLTQ